MLKTIAEGRRNRAARAYLAALDRLIEGQARHPDYAGRPVRITPAAVAKEARRSRNPLYTTHRALLAEIEAAASRPTPATDLAATVARLEASKPNCGESSSNCRSTSAIWRPRTCRCFIARALPRIDSVPAIARLPRAKAHPQWHRPPRTSFQSKCAVRVWFPDRALAHSGKSGIVAQMKEQPAAQPAIGVQFRPASAAGRIHLVISGPRKLHYRCTVTFGNPAIYPTLHCDEAKHAGPTAVEPNVAAPQHVDILKLP